MQNKAITICGAGHTGYAIARYLSGVGHEVTIIEKDESFVKKITSALDVRVITGNCTDIEVLRRAGKSDAIIACTPIDEVNVIACELASKVFEANLKIARVRNLSWLEDGAQYIFHRNILDVDYTIGSERSIAKHLVASLKIPSAFYVVSAISDQMMIIGVICYEDSNLVNTPISRINNIYPHLDMVIAAVVRAGKLIIATDELELKSGDRVYFAISSSQIKDAMAAFVVNYQDRLEEKKLLILGSGRVTPFLLGQMDSVIAQEDITIIEKDVNRAKEIATSFPAATVVCSSVIDQDIMHEIGIKSISNVIAMTDSDNTNILSSLIARQSGARYSSALVHNEYYSHLTGILDIDAAINSQSIIVSRILPLIRGGGIKSSYLLHNYNAEIIEAQILSSSALIGTSVGQLCDSDGVKLLCMMRDNILLQNRDDEVLRAYDILLLIVTRKQVRKICQSLTEIIY